MEKHAKVTGGGGMVNLAANEGSLFKKTLICHIGNFNGAYGPVEITRERLDRIAARYNSERANPQNENDYAPILVDHQRSADLTKGRVLADLSVELWTNPGSGVEEWGLFGTLRVDDGDAKQKVKDGKYAHVSMSFDEDTDELYEISFVAVEAARRSIVLSQGGLMDLEQQLAGEKTKRTAILARAKQLHQVRKAIVLSLGENLKASEADAQSLSSEFKTAVLKLRESALQGQFKSFIREGKLSKAEFDGLKFAELAALPTQALSVLLKSYAARPVSSHTMQFGQAGAKPIDLSKASPAKMRELMEAQRKGKNVVLEDGSGDSDKDKDQDDPNKDKESLGENDGAKFDDVEECMKFLESIQPGIDKISTAMKRMSEQLKSLADEKDVSEDGQ